MRVGRSAVSAAAMCVGDVARVLRRDPVGAHRAGERDEVRVAEVHGDRRDAAGLLLGADLVVAAAVDDHDRQRQPQLDAGHELLHGEHQRAVAEQARHRPVRRGQRRADRSREAVAERGEAGRVAERARRRLVEQVHGAEVGDLRRVAGEDPVGGQPGPHGGHDLGERGAVDQRFLPAGRAQLGRPRVAVGPRGQQRCTAPSAWRRRRRAARRRRGCSCAAGRRRRRGARRCGR